MRKHINLYPDRYGHTTEDITVSFNVGKMDYGEVFIPSGTKVVEKNSPSCSIMYVQNVRDIIKFRPEVDQQPISCFKHDATHYGVSVPKSIIELD